MSGIDDSGTPPEVPEEYSATYREAYLRALAEDPATDDPAGPDEPLVVGAGDRAEGRRLLPWVIGSAVALVLAILLAVVLTSGGGSPSSPPHSGTQATQPGRPPSHHPRASGTAPSSPTESSTTATTAPSNQVRPTRVTATCTAPAGVDAAGARVRYDAANTLDHDPSTAWRCDGSAVGERLTFTLPPGTTVSGLGIIPGYAKTDPSSGADRYAENNRITRARWTFSDGTVVVQELDPDPGNRALQVLTVPRTTADEVTLQVLAVARGPRNTTAISEVEFLTR